MYDIYHMHIRIWYNYILVWNEVLNQKSSYQGLSNVSFIALQFIVLFI